jgi:integrase/recombinase XerD
LRDLGSFLRFVEQRGQVISPGVFRLERPQEGKPLPRFLTEQAYAQLEAQVLRATAAGTADNRLDRAWFYVLAHAGLRVGELCDLRWEDLDLARQRLLVRDGKGLRDRALPITPTTVQALQAYREARQPASAGPVFTWRGKPLHADVVRGRLRRYGQAVGVEVSPHRLRHTLATRLLNAGMKITSLQRLLGHEKLTTTMIYAHVHDETVTQDFQHAMTRLVAAQVPQPVTQDESTALAQAFFAHPSQPVSVAR